MNMAKIKKMLSIIWCIVLVAALALNITGCAKEEPKQEQVSQNADTATITLGSGSKTFTFIAVDLDGVESKFEILTDADTVGEALIENQLIDGEQGDYGIYVKTVNGITLDWDRDAKYWSLLVDGEYAMAGADQIEITEGSVYTFLPAE